MAEVAGKVFLITGESGQGKSTLCAALVEVAKAHGWRVAGVMSPPRYEDGRKVGFDVADPATGERQILATRRGVADPGGPETLSWRFDRAAQDWGTALLARSLPCDLLVVDEIGPLELERGEGWQVALAVLARGGYRAALVVVRPALAGRFLARFPDLPLETVAVTVENRDALPATLWDRLQELS